MTIETKYNIGDLVFRMTNNKVVEMQVRKIRIDAEDRGDAPPELIFSYTLDDNQSHKESYLFPTRESLLQSL